MSGYMMVDDDNDGGMMIKVGDDLLVEEMEECRSWALYVLLCVSSGYWGEKEWGGWFADEIWWMKWWIMMKRCGEWRWWLRWIEVAGG